MMRIHFTSDDLRRVTIAPRVDPLWEVLLSLHMLQERDAPPAFEEWRRRTRVIMPAEARLLLELAPPLGYSPDFITPGRGEADLHDQVERVMGTAKQRLRVDIGELTQHRGETPWTKSLAAGEPEALRRLGRTLTEYHGAAIAPYRRAIQARIDADQELRHQARASGGVDRLLATLHSRAVWQPPVLTIPVYADQDLHLDGRGLTLVPSFFCRIQPITLRDNDLPPVLVYPVQPPLDWLLAPSGARRRGKDPVAALLGGTRAAVLRAATSGANTTDLGIRLGISTAAVSRHMAVLRDAGLVKSIRDGGSIFHHITLLGLELLNSDFPEQPPNQPVYTRAQTVDPYKDHGTI